MRDGTGGRGSDDAISATAKCRDEAALTSGGWQAIAAALDIGRGGDGLRHSAEQFPSSMEPHQWQPIYTWGI